VRGILGILGLVAIALLAMSKLDPPQPAALVDAPAPIAAEPIDDLTLNGGDT
jgi:hypothetical protein